MLKTFTNGMKDNITLQLDDKEYILKPKESVEIYCVGKMIIKSYDTRKKIHRKERLNTDLFHPNENKIVVGERIYDEIHTTDVDGDIYLGLSYIIPKKYCYIYSIFYIFLYFGVIILGMIVVLIVLFNS